MSSELKDRKCIYCESNDTSIKYSTTDIFSNNYVFRQCAECNVWFLTPKPTSELLAKAYDESYYGNGKEKFNKSYIEKVLDYFRKKRAQTIKRYIKSGKILDIGCGNGRFLSYMNQIGDYEIFGIEMEGTSAKRAASIGGLNLKIGALEKNDFAINTFEAITLFHVFEHLPNPKQSLEIIVEILKTHGILLISFPNIGSWQSRLFKGKWLHLDPPRHLSFFEPSDFVKTMNELGLELINEKHFNIEYNPYGMSQSILNVMCKKREVLYEHLKGNKSYVEEYSRLNLFFQDLFFKLSMPLFIITDFFESISRKGATVEFTFRKR